MFVIKVLMIEISDVNFVNVKEVKNNILNSCLKVGNLLIICGKIIKVSFIFFWIILLIGIFCWVVIKFSVLNILIFVSNLKVELLNLVINVLLVKLDFLGR